LGDQKLKRITVAARKRKKKQFWFSYHIVECHFNELNLEKTGSPKANDAFGTSPVFE
jgi:hypothetical protein